MIDLSNKKNTFTKALSEMIQNLKTMTYDQKLEKMISLVNDENIIMSSEARKKYLINIKKQTTANKLDFYICDICLAGSTLKVL